MSVESSILTMLPTGNISENYILNISVRVFNENGGYTELRHYHTKPKTCNFRKCPSGLFTYKGKL